MENFIYLVFSSTPFRLGKIIRKITSATYNHVSIALDPGRKEMYSFARRYYKIPFWGGFVREYPSRFHVNGKSSQFKIFRLPVSPEQYSLTKERLEEMYRNKERYLYNHLSVLAAPFRKTVPLEDACTCVEFCVDCLQRLGYPVQAGRYYSMAQLEAVLEPYAAVTEYAMPADPQDEFFHRHPVPSPLWVTLRDMFALLTRLKKHEDSV